MHCISKVRAKLNSLCIICSLGQLNFHWTSTLLPLASIKVCYFHTPGKNVENLHVIGIHVAIKCS